MNRSKLNWIFVFIIYIIHFRGNGALYNWTNVDFLLKLNLCFLEKNCDELVLAQAELVGFKKLIFF